MRFFAKFSTWVSEAAGHHRAFTIALASVLIWAVLGPHYGFSDTWQLVINTATTIVTFLCQFLNQNKQNRDTVAMTKLLEDIQRKLGTNPISSDPES